MDFSLECEINLVIMHDHEDPGKSKIPLTRDFNDGTYPCNKNDNGHRDSPLLSSSLHVDKTSLEIIAMICDSILKSS